MVPWIKMRTNLLDDPKVRIIAKAIGCNGISVTGGLYMLWSLADEYSTDGRLDGYDAAEIDKRFGKPGFAAALAMASVDWLEIGDNYVLVKRFDEHNGASAKVRSETAKRVQEHRKRNAKTVTKALTDEDEEEDKKKDPLTPKGGSEPTGFAAWWSAWPSHHRKKGRTKCLRKWERQRLESKAAEIAASLERCKESPDWTKQGGAFIPAPEKWLNDTPWETDPAEMVGSQNDESKADPVTGFVRRKVSESELQAILAPAPNGRST